MKYLTYTDGYDIRYEGDLWHCYRGEMHLTKKDGKPAAYKVYGLAAKFMAAAGAEEASPEPKKKAWVAPTSAVIAPLEEQLAKLSSERFVVIEAAYGFYKELGYAVWDRQQNERMTSTLHSSWNDVYDEKWKADEQAAKYNEEAPCEIEMDMSIFGMLAEVEQAYEQGKPASAPEIPPALEETTFVSQSPYQIGDEIKDKYDRTYVAIEESSYLSIRDVADLEDQDIFLSSGWHTKARLISTGEEKNGG